MGDTTQGQPRGVFDILQSNSHTRQNLYDFLYGRSHRNYSPGSTLWNISSTQYLFLSTSPWVYREENLRIIRRSQPCGFGINNQYIDTSLIIVLLFPLFKIRHSGSDAFKSSKK